MINCKNVKKLMNVEKWDVYVKGSSAIACKTDNTMMFRLSAQEAIELKAGKISINVDDDGFDRKDQIFEKVIHNFQGSTYVKDTGVLVDDGTLIRVLENNKRIITIDNARYNIGLFVSQRFKRPDCGFLVGYDVMDRENCLIAPVEKDVTTEILRAAALIPAKGENNE